MSNVVKAKGNMYGWVTHMWSPGKGCSHQCSYCYAWLSADRFGRDFPDTFQLDPHMPNLGKDRIIFVGHMCDMWAKDVSNDDINAISNHCTKYENEYVFQSKNPIRFLTSNVRLLHPTLGTTIETNRQATLDEYSKAPSVNERASVFYELSRLRHKTFITVEPIMDFDVVDLTALIFMAKPDWVNIGADSKKQDLPEPTPEKVVDLIERLRDQHIEVRIKPNLKRLLPDGFEAKQ